MDEANFSEAEIQGAELLMASFDSEASCIYADFRKPEFSGETGMSNAVFDAELSQVRASIPK